MKTSIKRAVHKRAHGCCEYCLSQSEFSHDDFSVEHIIPRVLGGSDDIDNLALSCQACNNRKFTATTAFDPITGEEVRLFRPRLDLWSTHFSWIENDAQVSGITAIGRATVASLKLNRLGLVNLRRALHKAGYHPPRDS
jgi:HNH endonuclease